MLLDIGAGGVLRGDFDDFGRVHEIFGKFADGRGKGCGKEQGLTWLGQHLHDFADVVDETHIQHAVGFVEDDDFDFVEVDVFLFDVVKQPADGGDDDFAAGAQVGGLFVHVDAAEEDGVPQRQVFDVTLHVLVDLVGKFARRGQHEHTHGVHRGRGAGSGVAFEAFQAGQHEGGSFACAGLGGGEQVVAGECFGDGGGLDGRRVFVTLFGQRGNDFAAKPE